MTHAVFLKLMSDYGAVYMLIEPSSGQFCARILGFKGIMKVIVAQVTLSYLAEQSVYRKARTAQFAGIKLGEP